MDAAYIYHNFLHALHSRFCVEELLMSIACCTASMTCPASSPVLPAQAVVRGEAAVQTPEAWLLQRQVPLAMTCGDLALVAARSAPGCTAA
jgi:hypothetical protein